MEGGHWISNEDWFVNKQKKKAKYDRQIIHGKMIIVSISLFITYLIKLIF